MTYLPITLERIIRSGVVEDSRIECKSTWDPEASLKTICAFANDIENLSGGYIIIGIQEENGERILSGIPEGSIDRIQKDILNKCRLIQPGYMPVVSHEVLDDKHFLVLWAPGGPSRPYRSPAHMGKDTKNSIYWFAMDQALYSPTKM